MNRRYLWLQVFDLKKLLLLFLLLVLLFGVILYLERRALVYPELHRFQLSPKDFIQSKKLPAELVRPEVIEHGSRAKKQLALTFDADMTPAMLVMLEKGIVKSWYNQEIKTIIDRENIHATVFLGGLWSKTYPNEARDLARDKLIELGNHSYNHSAFTVNCFKLPFIENSENENEVLKAQETILAITGVSVKYFRFPGGCYDRVDIETVAKLGLKIVHWDISANDGFNNDARSIINRVESQVQNGSIVVFHIHDGSFAPKTHEAIKVIIPDLRKRGFEFVTISELLKQ